ncbi:hypothetical protein K1Y72_33900 [Actinomadura sp. PM05-2]|uniref:Clp R domain-containing protein n=1 Tax=Actinomadura parmotrematis TaxID=2864039 RepID=A0ABS7G682_9ACTN|nr:hypothetical protein [Actinomadura parmotrematis]
MFERFTDRARQVVVLAQEEARLLNHDYIGTEHLLLGLLRAQDGVIDGLLAPHGLDLPAGRARVEEIIGEGRRSASGHIPFTPRAKRVLELGLREALQLGHDDIGTGHLLLGLLIEEDGVAAQIIAGTGADPAALRRQTINALAAGAPAARPAPHRLGEPRILATAPAPAPRPEERLAAIELRLAAIEEHLAAIADRLGREGGSDEPEGAG